MQRSIKYVLASVAAYVCLCFSVALAAGSVSAVTLTWTGDPQTSQTITWQTPPGSEDVYVQYSEADTPDASMSLVKVEKAVTRAFTSEARTNAVHTVTLRGLNPGARYVYRIGDGTQWAKDGRFRTETPGASFKFLLFGDSQSYDYNVWKMTFEAACRTNRDARFFVNVGDLVDNGQTQREWDGWFAAVSAHAPNLSVVPVVGNHETYTPERTFSMPQYFTQQFFVPQNGPEGLRGQVYSFDYGDVHFAVLDSQFGEERKFLPDSLERQKAWLEKDLAATNRRWKIVLMHRPAYHNRLSEPNPDITAQFAPIFDAYGVDAVLSGHDHVNARTPKLKAGVPAPDGTVYATIGRSGTKVYDTVGKKNWDEQFFNPVDQPTYTVVNVTDHVFYVQVFKQSGEPVDAWSLMKVK